MQKNLISPIPLQQAFLVREQLNRHKEHTQTHRHKLEILLNIYGQTDLFMCQNEMTIISDRMRLPVKK